MSRRSNPRKHVVGLFAASALLVSTFVAPLPSQATSSLLPQTPATLVNSTSVGMNEMFKVSGQISVSTDGLSMPGQTGNLQVEKPTNTATVVGAYLTLAGSVSEFGGSSPSGVTLDGDPVTFTHSARATTAMASWANFLADVTNLLKQDLDSASAGVINVAVDEGADSGSINGTSLIVIFDVGSGANNTVMFLFGTTDPAGSTATANFSAIGSGQLTGHTLSLGIGWGGQLINGNYNQSSEVKVSTSLDASQRILSSIAGGENDGFLFTVGGVGDSTDNPAGSVFGTDFDDELYDISTFLAAGDTSITLTTRNASGDDNLFQAVIFLAGVSAQGAAQAGSQDPNSSAQTPAAPVPYTGPVPGSLSVGCVPAGTASTVVLSGERLNTITSAVVDGKSIVVSEISASSIKLAIPALAAGTYSVVYSSSNGSLTHQESLKVCASSIRAGGPFEAQRLFSNYRGDRGPVIARDRAAIAAFINQYQGITAVRCVGSTSGVPAKNTDPALARARAKNACDIVKQLIPNATVSLETSTGKGIGQRFRSVTIFISGTN